jgi:hypothetical protein
MYQQFNYGTRMTRMVRIFADLYMKTRLNLRHPRAIFIIETGNGLSKKIKQK